MSVLVVGSVALDSVRTQNEAHDNLLAERFGLVDEVVEDGELPGAVAALARAIAAHSPLALRLAKDAVRAALEAPLSAGLAYERELFITAFGSNDKAEGVRAFFEKRAPRFTGR